MTDLSGGPLAAGVGSSTGSYRWWLLAVATFNQAGTAIVFLGLGALAGFIQEAFRLSGAQTGLLVAAVGLVPLFAMIPVGWLLDRRSERLVISGGALLLAAGAAGAALAPSYGLVLGLLLLGGAGYSPSQPGGSKVVAAWFPARQRGLAMGIRQTGLPLGGTVAAALLPAVASSAGWRAALLTAATVAAAGGTLFAVVYRRAGNAAAGSARHPFAAELRGLLRRGPVRGAMWAGIAMVGAQFAVISYLMLFLRDVHGLALPRGAWMLFAAQAGGVAGRVALAAWTDRLRSGRLPPVIWSLLLTALTLAVFAALPAPIPLWAALALAVVLGFFGFGWYGPWVVHVAEAAPSQAVGLTLALAMAANQIGIVVAPPLFGLTVDVTNSYRAAWLGLAALLVLVAARLMAAGPRFRTDPNALKPARRH